MRRPPPSAPRAAWLRRADRAPRLVALWLAVAVLALALACGLAWGTREHVVPLARSTFAAGSPTAAFAAPGARQPVDGVRFACEPAARERLESAMSAYLDELGVAAALVRRVRALDGTAVTYQLATPDTDTDTLDLRWRPQLDIRDELVTLPARAGRSRAVLTVSRKEIVLALLQHGRLTQFPASACDIAALRDLVGVRQNIVAWAEQLNWNWPDGTPARWNPRYWHRGTPARTQLAQALTDAFVTPQRYAIGCYTATKLVIAQGVLDYYRRVKGDVVRAALIEQRLWADGEPLVDLEPHEVWAFEADFDQTRRAQPGKLLGLQREVAARNFVPGDWAYFLNTDAQSYAKTGYEGSNAVYLGRNRFNDHYNDHNHAYSFEEKLDMVYQWRHGVFSASRDVARVHSLTGADLVRLARTPQAGGVLLDVRLTPHLFGYAVLPALAARVSHP